MLFEGTQLVTKRVAWEKKTKMYLLLRTCSQAEEEKNKIIVVQNAEEPR